MFDKKKGRCFRYSAGFCLTLCLTAGLAGCAGAPEASNTQESMKAVSYTHLDVYKRQAV